VHKPGGRFAVSDMVFPGDKNRVPAEVMRSAELWSACVAGAAGEDRVRGAAAGAGFEDVSVEVTYTCETELASAPGCCGGSEVSRALGEVPLASPLVRACEPVH